MSYMFYYLCRQHGETVRRYDQTRKELDYYRGQNQVMINQIEQAAQESSSLRAKLAVEKQMLDRSQQVSLKFNSSN